MIGTVREAGLEASANSEPPAPPQVNLVGLVLDARVLLADMDHPNEIELHRTFNEWQLLYAEQRAGPVTTESLNELSAAIRRLDPEFQAAWRAQVLRTYPWLDRMLPPETTAAD